MYSFMFSFTSTRAKVDTKINNGRGSYIYRLNGQNYHRIGSLVPCGRMKASFAHLYIYDTTYEIEN